jgi:hypothetical protein
MKKVLETLDQLALALINHNHTWTIEERQNYEQSIKTVKSNPVEPLVKPQMADELMRTKVQLYLAKNESITKAAKELRELMMIKLDGNDCEIKYKTDTGEPFLEICNFAGYSYNHIKLELESVRKLKQWLNDIGM